MSIEMADQTDFDHSGLQEVANAVRDNSGADELLGGTNQKRKRELSDQDGSADAMRRPASKRLSPNIQKNVNEASDPSANAFMDAEHEGDAGSIQDYSNLHDQSIENQNGAADHANASSTAAAALGIYPTMTIPQPTGLQFQTQSSEGDNQDSFMDTSQQNESYMDSTAGAGGRGGGPKPAVGSEEWHKVRKDNHKEGMLSS
jgi:transcriptional regulator CBF1